jgi:glutamate carboxypeptidase
MNSIDYQELKQIIEINSYTGNKAGVDEASARFATWIEALGMQLERHHREHIGDHLLFRSRHTGGKKLLLLGHLDTVFAPGSFEGFHEDEAWIYGPGVCDMKGGNYIALQALRNLYAKRAEITDIDLLLVSDEETGSDDSRHLSGALAPEYDYCMVFEAAGEHGEIVTGRKGIGLFSIEIEGVAKHAGNHYWEGADANQEAAHKLLQLNAISNQAKQTTLNVGMIEGGIGANTISPTAKLTFDLRYTDTGEKERALREIDAITENSHIQGTRSTLTGSILRDVMQPTPAQQAWVASINTLCKTTLPTEKRGGVSDANIIASAGTVVTDGWGPFGDGDHTVHERASKQSFVERIALVSEIFEHHVEGRI